MRDFFLFSFLFLFLAACAVVPPQQRPPVAPLPEPVFCTMDAKVCPDGSAVGRVGPNCEFAPCPVQQVSSDACATDADCICDGFDMRQDRCFVGNKDYYDLFVNKTRQCPDFCTGIANNFETKCVERKCAQVTRRPFAKVDVVASPGVGPTPLVTMLTATLSGPAPASFNCERIRWEFGDTLNQSQEMKCAIPAGAPMDKTYKITHKYARPGNYSVSFTVGLLHGEAVVVVYPQIAPPECDKDSDCVPAQCCHAADCIIKEKRADCSKVACTMECRPGTMDCGGGCACIANRCTGQKFFPGEDTFTGPRPWQAYP